MKRAGALFTVAFRVFAIAICAFAAGCGTTRWSDTSRTATEQMLVSDAVDRSISQIDFTALAERPVYLDTKYITGIVDDKYVVSTLRQHMLASGCVIKDKAEDAAYVVEVRVGTIGTNRNDVLCGVPATSLPAGGAIFPLAPTSIPEISLIKRTAQQGVCKLAVFAYDRQSGRPVWQSGTRQVASRAKDTWVFGAGPFQRGTIYDGTKFAGEKLTVPLTTAEKSSREKEPVGVTQEILFDQPRLASSATREEPAYPTARASYVEPRESDAPTAPSSAAPPGTTNNSIPSGAPTNPPPVTSGNSAFSMSTAPNTTAGAFGAAKAINWAKDLRRN